MGIGMCLRGVSGRWCVLECGPCMRSVRQSAGFGIHWLALIRLRRGRRVTERGRDGEPWHATECAPAPPCLRCSSNQASRVSAQAVRLISVRAILAPASVQQSATESAAGSAIKGGAGRSAKKGWICNGLGHIESLGTNVAQLGTSGMRKQSE